jgi:hypothetical protein
MKTLFVSLAFSLFAFFIGCQSSITDPLQSDNSEKFSQEENFVNKDVLAYYPGMIKLNGIMVDPTLPFNNYVTISGQVRYNIEAVTFAAIQNAIKVGLYVNAEMKNELANNRNPWTVNETSEDVVYFSSNDAEVYLTKYFRVNNTVKYPLNLVLEFRVEGKKLILVSKSLELLPYSTVDH